MPSDLEKIQELVRHINSVQENGVLLGTRLIEKGYNKLGIALIERVYSHDIGKFRGIEFEFLSHNNDENVDKEKLAMAISHHNQTNRHHPEYHHDGIHGFSDLDTCEWISDIKSRANAFGSCLKTWIDEEASKRYGFTKKDKIYKKIMFFLKILLGNQFKKLPKVKKPKESKNEDKKE